MTRSRQRTLVGHALAAARWSRHLIPDWQRPPQVVVTAFAVAILVGTLLLMQPAATTTGEPAGFVTALFTATSSVCVTGLIVEDTPSYWSSFGEGVIAALIQAGGLGIMTLASLLGVLIAGRLGLRLQRSAQVETRRSRWGTSARWSPGSSS